ncbi:MAG: Crp/Fnr family transcriptional regulator [Elusimicrobiota bacterium]|nr:Crp/Fnr family transcriptional regulator [Elusimicrobiota bacterium]
MTVTILKQVPFFSGLNNTELNKVLAIARVKKYTSGQMVFAKEDLGDNFFVVKTGRIKIFTTVGSEKRKTFAFLKKGDFFGEMSLLGGKTRSASAQAADDSELFVIPKKSFKMLILENPDFTLKLLYTLTDRLNKADKEIESMLFHNILGRLADAILELSKDKHTKPVKMAIDQNELAQYLGTTRVPVCRAINTLKRSGVIDYHRGELIILNSERLHSIAGKAG